MSDFDDGKFDGMFLNIAQQAHGIDPLFDALFSFLRRKTDFFSGASPEKIEESVLNAIKKQQVIHDREKEESKRKKAEDEKKKEKLRLEKEKKEREAAAARAKAAGEEDVLELGADGTFDSNATASKTTSTAPKSSTVPMEKNEKAEDDVTETKAEEEEEEDKTPPPPGNGGTTEKYSWTQTLSEVTQSIFLPPGTKSKMLDVDIKNTSLKVKIKGQSDFLIQGAFHKRIIVDDSIWTVEDGNLVLSLQKENKMEWYYHCRFIIMIIIITIIIGGNVLL